MIAYSPITGDARLHSVVWRYQTAFIMQQLRPSMPPEVIAARKTVGLVLRGAGFKAIDATNATTGRDYLDKIWNLILGCPVGIAIVHEGVDPDTMANIFYELGMLHAYGRETVVVKVGKPKLPSDFLRTEYISAGTGFRTRFKQFVDELPVRSAYYIQVADSVENNPLLAIDYLRRAALLCGDRKLNARARQLLDGAQLGERAKASVERMMLEF